MVGQTAKPSSSNQASNSILSPRVYPRNAAVSEQPSSRNDSHNKPYPLVVSQQASPMVINDQSDTKYNHRLNGGGNTVTNSSYQNYSQSTFKEPEVAGSYKAAPNHKNLVNLPEDSLQNKYDGNIYDYSKFGGDFRKKITPQINSTNLVSDIQPTNNKSNWPGDPPTMSRIERPSHDDRFTQPKSTYEIKQPDVTHSGNYMNREPKLSYTLQNGQYMQPTPSQDLSQSTPSYPTPGPSQQPSSFKPLAQLPAFTFYQHPSPGYGDRPLASSQLDYRQGVAPLMSERSKPKEEPIYAQNTAYANNYGRIVSYNY